VLTEKEKKKAGTGGKETDECSHLVGETYVKRLKYKIK